MRIFCFLVLMAIFISVSRAGMLASGTGLRGLYYSNPDMSGTRVVKYHNTVTMSWKEDTGPISEMKPGAFSVVYRGYLLPEFSENYTFTLTSRGGVLLIINNIRLIDDWTSKGESVRTGSISLKSNKMVPVIIQSTQPAGGGDIQFLWSCNSLPIENVPVARIYPPVFAPAQYLYNDNPDNRAGAINQTNLFDTPVKLTVEGSSKPVFSPDGKKFLFQTAKNLSYSTPGIYRYTFNSHEQIRLSKSDGDKYDPSFSADGKTVVFVSQIGDISEIWTMRPDGGGRTKIISNNYENRHPVINTDGSMIVYQSKRDGVWNLYGVSISEEGIEEKQLTTLQGTEPAINAAGDRVIFISSRAGQPQLYVMNIDGSEQALFCDVPGIISQPFFTQNRDAVSFLKLSEDGKNDIYTADFNDRVPCRITSSGKIMAFSAFYESRQLPYYTEFGRTSKLVWDDDGTMTTNDSTYFNGPFGNAATVSAVPGSVPITGVSALRLPGGGTSQWETGNLFFDWVDDDIVFRFWYYIPETVSPVRLAMSFTPDTTTGNTKGVSLGAGEWKEQIVYDIKPQITSLKSTLVIGEWTQVTVKRADCGGGYNGTIMRAWPLFIGNGNIYLDGMRFERQ